jgi:iron complex outermembrane receptor protein
VDIHASKRKSPKIAVYGKPANQIAQSIAHTKGADAAKTGSDRLEDFVDYLPGIQVADGNGVGSAITIRGFRATQGQIDGLPDVLGFYLRDPATLESIDIAKGRDSTLFGIGTPGGAISYTSKKPSLTPKRSMGLQIGSPSQVRGFLDITGPLSTKGWTGRLLVSGQQAETGYVNVGDDRLSILPSLRWVGENQSLLLNMEHGWQNREANDIIVWLDGKPTYNMSYVDPRSQASRRMTRLGFTYTHQLNEQWEASLQASRIEAKRKETHIGIGIPSDEPDIWYDYYRKLNMEQTQTALKGELRHEREVGKLQQETRIGINQQGLKSSLQQGRLLGTSILNIRQPVFGYPLPDDSQLQNIGSSSDQPERAWYLQHQSTWNDKLGISLGVSNSHTKADTTVGAATQQTIKGDDTNTSVGLTWQVNPQWQGFASRVESIDTNIGRDRNLNLFAPEQSIQHEIGVRYEEKNTDRKPLTANLSAYQLKRNNVLTPDPLDSYYSVLTGAMQTDGVELEIAKPLTPKLKLSTSYSYSDARITSSNSGKLGNHLSNVPRHSGALTLTYQPAADTELALGVVKVGKRPGDNLNSFEVPAYTRVDAAARWKLDKKTTLNAGVRNLLDTDYVAGSSDETALVQGRKRSVTLGIQVDF